MSDRAARIAALAASFLLCAVTSERAKAEFIVNVEQVGPNVMVTGSGTLDLSGLTKDESFGSSALINPSQGLVSFGPNPGVNVDAYFGFTGPLAIGPGFETLASTSSGDAVGIIASENQLIVPQGFMGGSLSASMTFDNTTIADLGLLTGTFTWSWTATPSAPDDSFGINIGTTTVTPLPAALPLFATGLGALGLLGWRRKRKAQTVAA
jgi:hypothetical protein